jgi:hypothetical protein
MQLWGKIIEAVSVAIFAEVYIVKESQNMTERCKIGKQIEGMTNLDIPRPRDYVVA